MGVASRAPSKNRLRASKPPPPPPPRLPPPEDEELELELELELDDELLLAPGVAPEVTGAAQGLLPAFAGAWLVALAGVTVTSALSIRPWLSVTVTRSLTDPEVGATTVAVLVLAPRMAGGLVVGSTTVHANPATLRPQAAALAEALNVAFCPGETEPGRETAAMGRSAASTALKASAMPAPQVAVVHRHCDSWKSWLLAGTWQTGTAGSSATDVGKGRADSRRRSSIWRVDRFALRDNINAAIPETMGAEKLVPRLLLVWSV